MRSKGFTLIELVVVMVVLGVLAVVAIPKYIDIANDADKSILLAMKGSLKSAADMTSIQITLRPDNLNNNRNRFTLSNGDRIRVRGLMPDGRWNNTFAFLVDFDDITQSSSDLCSDDTVKWCVRQKGQGWFNNRGYSNLGAGRGFIIYPTGTNVGNHRCYIYFMNQNANATPDTVNPYIVGSDFSEC